ncbi:MAG: lipopolysaccharide biosynthesis protein [Gemmatimonas sp.]
MSQPETVAERVEAVTGRPGLDVPPSAEGASAAASGVDTSTMDRSLVRSMAWTGAVKWASQVLSWASTFVVARLLSPDDYGLLGMATVFLGLVTIFSEFGLGLTVVTLKDLTEEQLAQLNTVSLMIGVSCAVLVCIMAFPLGWFFKSEQLPFVVFALSLGFIINAFRIVPAALIQRDLDFKLLALLEGAQAIVLAAAMVLLAYLGFRYWTLVLGSLMGSLMVTLFTLRFRRVHFKKPRRETLAKPLEFTKHQIVGNLSWYAYSNADFLMAGRLLGETQLGVYTMAWSLALTIPEKVTAMVTRVIPAYFASIQNDAQALRRYLVRLTEFISLVTFPVLLGLALVADDFVALALGDRWTAVIGPLRILAIYAAYDSAVGLFSRVLNVTGDTRFMMNVGIALALVMPVAFYVGSHWGPVGIAAAWIIAHPFSRIPIFMRLSRRIELPWTTYLMAYWPAVSGAALMAVAVFLVRHFLTADARHVERLIAQVAAGAVTYVAVLFVLHGTRMRALLGVVRGARAG